MTHKIFPIFTIHEKITHMKTRLLLIIAFVLAGSLCFAQEQSDKLLSIDRIYASQEFSQQWAQPFQWIDGGNAYVKVEWEKGAQSVAKYITKSKEKTVIIPSEALIPEGKEKPIRIEDISFSNNLSKVLIFTNSARVWRTNTKGDYWVFDIATQKLQQIGKEFPASSLMFAKFSPNNDKVAYVSEFNIYTEDLTTGKVTALTTDGGQGIINGTFDWVYEEEFGCKDGFSWNPEKNEIAFWNLDASTTGTFYMIDNLDSVYARLIPLQYPKVGETPSACKVGVVDVATQAITWIPIEGSATENYIPGMQWIDAENLLIQQMNRHQNKLTVWIYHVPSKTLKTIYTETEETWVDLQYPDVSASWWTGNALLMVDNNQSFLRLTENDGWRHLYKINIASGEKTLLTEGDYDVASLVAVTKTEAYFHASPSNSTQRYLYSVSLNGGKKPKQVTPSKYEGINIYKASPNGKYALHTYGSALAANKVDLVTLPKHNIIEQLVTNTKFEEKLATLDLPTVEFFKVTTEEGIEIDGRMIKPSDFDPSKKYPVLFHVYGEPWGQVATDNFIGMWNIMIAQKGFIIIDMDNRGTPCLKGSEWRKSIYRKVGVVNAHDQALAAKEVLKFPYIDANRTTVWGWSGGGSMTLNLMFRYPEIYKTGMAVAAVSNQLIYDNIYQERYMGLPQENLQDFINGSPITYAKDLQGNLLVVHGTHDDNVHYQSMEMLVDELITQNKQFTMMAYPNRSHGLYERSNTTRHLYTLLTNYLLEHNK